MLKEILPQCPHCRTPVPFSKSLFGRGRSFTCEGCGKEIVVAKGGAAAGAGLFAMLFFIWNKLTQHPYGFVILSIIIAVAVVVEYLFIRVSLLEKSKES